MGYEAHSPVKQVWLPFELNWLANNTGSSTSFKNFASAYKEKYGIDLHDIFALKKNVSNEYYIATGNYLVSAYSKGTMYAYDTVLVNPFAIIDNVQAARDEANTITLMNIGVTSSISNVSMSVGITLMLPNGVGDIESIDDLIVHLYEL